METYKFYDVLQPMECFAGDTSPAILIGVEGLDPDTCTVQLAVAEERYPTAATLTLPCMLTELEEGTKVFSVRLTSAVTSGMQGAYRLYIIITDENGLQHIKLVGTLTVLPSVSFSG